MSAFEGLYFKHQTEHSTLAFIVGRGDDNAFIQVISDSFSHCFLYARGEYRAGKNIRLGGCTFGREGISVHIEKDGLSISGAIFYRGLTPLKSDIMGPFRFLPMQCRHRIVSLYHRLEGKISVGGRAMDFSGGIGYIEGDRGRSFPDTYTWLHCAGHHGRWSLSLSAAKIPLLLGSFQGCICAIYHRGRQYRLATYSGAKILRCEGGGITLRQGRTRLEVTVSPGAGHALSAPCRGKMNRVIEESVACRAEVRFFKDGALLFHFSSARASFEHVT